MPSRKPISWWRYSLAFATVGVALLLRLLLKQVLGIETPFAFFYAAVAISAGFGGLVPGLMATALSAVAEVFVVSSPPYRLVLPSLTQSVHAVLFLSVSLLICILSETLHHSYRRADSARREAEAEQQRVAFLAETGRLLSSSLDYTTTLQNLTRLVLTNLGDWCAIDVLEDDEAVRYLAVAHRDQAMEPLVRDLQSRYPLNPSGQNPLHTAMNSGQPDLHQNITDADLIAAARDAEHLEMLRALRLRSYLCMPLIARERTLGTLLVASALPDRYSPADVSLAVELAGRAALAVDNARLYRAAQQEITERSRAEEALRASEARIHAIVRSAVDGIITIDENGMIETYNPAAEAMFGWTAEEALGRSISTLMPSPHRERHNAYICRYLETGEARIIGSGREVEGLRKDGTTFPMELGISEIRLGERRLFTGFVRDITERKRHLAEIEDLNERLRRSMVETHHRVKNNLQIIAAMVDMRLMDEMKSIPAAEFERLGTFVRVLASVHDILTQEAKGDGRVQDVSARMVLSKLLPLMQQAAGETRIAYTLDDTRLTLRQGTSLALVVNELVNNAVKHGGRRVEVTLHVQGGAARLCVSDEGPGFPSGFDASKSANTGLELVLNLSRWDLGGDARFENQPEGGACVLVEFPLSAPADDSASLPSDTAVVSGSIVEG